MSTSHPPSAPTDARPGTNGRPLPAGLPGAPGRELGGTSVAGSSSWARQFRWCVRAHGWVVLVGVLLGAAVPLLGQYQPPYEAESVVVVREVVGRTAQVPNLVDDVFHGQDFARLVTADPAIGGRADQLVPGRLDIVTEPESVVVRIIGRSADPNEALVLADVGGAVLVEQLNRSGVGVASFALLSPTESVRAPSPLLSPWALAAAGAALGALCALGVMAGLAAYRRPMVDGDGVEATLGTPVLGTVVLPALCEGERPEPRGVPGLAAVARRLAELPPGRVTLVSEIEATRERNRLLVLLATVLNRGGSRQGYTGAADQQVLADGGTPLDAIDLGLSGVRVLLVVGMGIPRARLRRLAADYTKRELVGAVIVDFSRQRRGTRQPDMGCSAVRRVRE